MKHTGFCNYLITSNIINHTRILCFIFNNPYGITSWGSYDPLFCCSTPNTFHFYHTVFLTNHNFCCKVTTFWKSTCAQQCAMMRYDAPRVKIIIKPSIFLCNFPNFPSAYSSDGIFGNNVFAWRTPLVYLLKTRGVDSVNKGVRFVNT